MIKTDLNGKWIVKGNGYECEGTVPGSVYSFLLNAGLMEDPFYRDNELKALELMDHEYEFSRDFDFELDDNRVLLHCDGLDTLCDLYINDRHLAYTSDMHRTFEFDVTDYLKNGNNQIKVVFHPVDKYLKEVFPLKPTNAPTHPLKGFGNIRKANCMHGWDWGPQLPDAGIWRDIYLLTMNSARITDIRITQRHSDGKVYITPHVCTDKEAEMILTLTSPDGCTTALEANKENEIDHPHLWWPNGLGDQPLYEVKVELIENGEVVDSQSRRIGLRTMKLIRERDKYGEGFCHEVNGVRFFAMGANYIPEDSIFSRITPGRTRTLLQNCKNCHFNAIRVWGGGYYPDNYFFDYCDEFGLIVFFDMMFACSSVPLDESMIENIKAELHDNLTRLRHHASIALICGNNEIEEMFAYKKTEGTEDYLLLFEDIIPSAIQELCHEIPYVPSSPSSYGHFVDPQNENFGDSHFWEVWHYNAPFTAYRSKYFRYLSEFGFQSFPCEKTVNSFTLPEDRNIFSRIMEKHQRNDSANGKMITYLSDNYKYPTSFGTLLYTSQIMQAEAMKYGVEHLRRNRGRCMGALYWQLNDIWPVASWASIDYFGRYKALQYYAARFYNPILISCCEIGEFTTRPYVNMERTVDYSTKATLAVTNDTLNDLSGTVYWELRKNDGEMIESQKVQIEIPALSVTSLDELDFHKTDVNHNYLYFYFEMDGKTVSSGSVLFTAPKYFEFLDPDLKFEIKGDEITVFSNAYAKSVEIYSPDSDFILSDNYFDMNPGKRTVKILNGSAKTIELRSVYDIR